MAVVVGPVAAGAAPVRTQGAWVAGEGPTMSGKRRCHSASGSEMSWGSGMCVAHRQHLIRNGTDTTDLPSP